MIAYKLFRVKANGDITSLFINKSLALPLDVWMEHENHPTKGFKERPGWHCCRVPHAPHLSEKGRAWYRVEMEGVKKEIRPESQGGVWYLADKIKILSPIKFQLDCPDCEGKLQYKGMQDTDWHGVLSYHRCPACKENFVQRSHGELEIAAP